MSRLAKKPLTIPQGVEVTLKDSEVVVKGTKGTNQVNINPYVAVKREENTLVFNAKDNSRKTKALLGTVYALVRNSVKGVTEGFECKLMLVGVGYRAQLQGKKLNLTLGFSHPIVYPIPEGITIETPAPTEIIVKGINKQVVGQVGAEIRGFRPPEPYKGKGVRYASEVIVLKETKKK